MKKRGYKDKEIAAKTGLNYKYVLGAHSMKLPNSLTLPE